MWDRGCHSPSPHPEKFPSIIWTWAAGKIPNLNPFDHLILPIQLLCSCSYQRCKALTTRSCFCIELFLLLKVSLCDALTQWDCRLPLHRTDIYPGLMTHWATRVLLLLYKYRYSFSCGKRKHTHTAAGQKTHRSIEAGKGKKDLKTECVR